MRLQIALIAFLQVVPVESLRQVSGYVGDNVTLPSGADPSWNLSKVEWSIFSNNTWIATYHKGKEITERFYQYKGRLSLNISSGDLMIHNLNINDAMEYRADLISTEGVDSVNKMKLIVRQRLQKPTVTTVTSLSTNRGCWVLLHCNSSDEGVDFTWKVKPPSMTVINMSDRDGSAVALSHFPNSTQDQVEVTCTSSRNMDKASSVSTPKCDADKRQPQPQPQPKNRYYAAFFMGGILGASLTVIVIFFFRQQIKAAWEYLKCTIKCQEKEPASKDVNDPRRTSSCVTTPTEKY